MGKTRTGYVYLIRNGDLYKIGKTNSLQESLKELKPDEIIKTIQTDFPDSLEARLFRKYKLKRIPETNYFRLSKKQLIDCKNQLGGKSHSRLSLGSEFSIGITGSIFLFLFVFLFSLYFQQGIIQSIVYGLASSSIPMWSLFILGNFGGYDVNDLPLFSCWFTRLKGFLIALSISFSSYLLSLLS